MTHVLSIRRGIVAAVSLILLASAIGSAILWSIKRDLIAQIDTISTVILPNTVALNDTIRIGLQVQAAMRAVVLDPGDGFARKNVERSLGEFDPALAAVANMARRDSVKQELALLRDDWNRKVVPLVQSIIGDIDAGRLDQAKTRTAKDLNVAWRDVKARIEKLIEERNAANTKEISAAKTDANRASLWGGVAVFAAFAMGVAIAVWLIRYVTHRVAAAQRVVDVIARERDLAQPFAPTLTLSRHIFHRHLATVRVSGR